MTANQLGELLKQPKRVGELKPFLAKGKCPDGGRVPESRARSW